MMELRQYQRDAIDGIYYYYEGGGTGNPLLVCPTGSGKSVILAKFCQESLQAWELNLLILSHRKEILSQNANKLLTIWPEAPIGIYSAGLRSRSIRQITIAGIQSVYKHADLFGPLDLILIDECHLVPKSGEGMYLNFIEQARRLSPKLKIIGLTATPYRLDAGLLTEGEGRIFTDIAYEIELVRLIQEGYLAPLISKSPVTQADLSQVHMRGGEFIAGEAEKALDQHDLTTAAIKEMMRLAESRKSWLVFCAGVDHTRHVTAALRQAGISAEYVIGETLPIIRQDNLNKFIRGEIRALVNCDVLTTGFDAPNCDCIVLLRPTASPGLYVQMVGRGSRLAPDKKDCLVLDFAGNIQRHGPIDMITVRKKDKGSGAAPVKTCQVCRLVVPIGTRVCPECGTEFPRNRTTTHDSEASTADIISAFKMSVETMTIEDVVYRKHYKQKDGSTSFRVDYRSGLNIVSEWVCFDHDGYPRQRACQWWWNRTEYPTRLAPQSVDEALERAHELRRPTTIKAKRSLKGYWQIINILFTETPESRRLAEGRELMDELNV